MIKGQEIAKHRTKDSCWIVIRDKIYDVTTFLPSHPGGVNIILRSAGGAATKEYESVHSPDIIKEHLPSEAFLGIVEPETLVKPEQPVEKKPSQYPPLSSIFNLDDFEAIAKKYLSPTGWVYYTSGADDEYSKQENHRIFRKIKFRPRVMRNVEAIDTSTNILGKPSSLPIYVSPAGLGKYAHPQAECTLAIGAGKEGIIQCVPTSPSMSLEAIYGARLSKQQPMFQQLYVNKDREKATSFIKRVINLGTTSLFITVDSPVLGNRERDDRLKGEVSGQCVPICKLTWIGINISPQYSWCCQSSE